MIRRLLARLSEKADEKLIDYVMKNADSDDAYKRATAEGLAKGRMGPVAWAFYEQQRRHEQEPD